MLILSAFNIIPAVLFIDTSYYKSSRLMSLGEMWVTLAVMFHYCQFLKTII